MKKQEIQFWKNEMLSYYDTMQDLKKELEKNDHLNDSSLAGTMKYFIDGGCFTVSIYDVIDLFRKLYGESFKEGLYIRKNGDLRYKGSEPVIWHEYKNKMAIAVSKLLI